MLTDKYYTNNLPIVLVILDGWGIAPDGPGNAISLAHKPNFNSFLATYPHTQLQASGSAVGLPQGEAGNSEVGHLNIGAGKIVYQEVQRINMAIEDGSFMDNEVLTSACNYTKKVNSKLHLMGLVGRGVVHSSLNHLYALLKLAKKNGLTEVYIHLFTDGRDSPPDDASVLVPQIEQEIKNIGIGKIVSIIGRYYGMDRDNRWDRVELAYNSLVLGEGFKAETATEIIENSYKNNVTDEFIKPGVIVEKSEAIGRIDDKDAVIFFNFRGDRARELTKAFIQSDFSSFQRKKVLKNLVFVSFSEYEKDLKTLVAFPPMDINVSLAKVLSEKGKRQLHISETEKYAHVTYFINAGRELPFPAEDRIHIPSAKVPTYDQKPEMSAYEITEACLQRLPQRIYDVIIINFANADMVGHTGKIPETIKAVEVIDECLGKLSREVLALDGTMIITADHGNAEEMINLKTNQENTEHSKNPVPFIIINRRLASASPVTLTSGILADVTPTILALMGIPKPYLMSGKDLLRVYKITNQSLFPREYI